MLGSTAVRIYVVAVLILATYGVARWVQGAIEPPKVVLPRWTFEEMPLEFGDWRGAPTKMDPDIAVAVNADRIVDREYKDDRGHVVYMHTAMFKKLADGVYHAPLNCYRSKGFQLIKETREKLPLSDGSTIPVSFTTWDREGEERVMVIYWYQVGEQVIFDRWDLGVKVRWSLRGRPTWPAMIKVMVQIAAPEPEDAKTTILSFAEQVAKWENKPEHRKDALSFDTTRKGG